MKNNKLLKYLIIITIALISFLIIGKKLGFIGASKPIHVTVEKVSRRNIVEIITANGKIEPELEIKVSADVSGEIIDIYIKEGEEVSKGQLLLKIKPNIYISARDRAIAALNSARANYDNARARYEQSIIQFEKVKLSYERLKKLWEQQTISNSDWEIAQSEYQTAQIEVKVAQESVKAAEFSVKSAEASVNEAEENLSKTSVYAPMNGIITKLNVEKGERVVGTEMMAGTELLRVAKLNRMKVKVTVNENDIIRVKKGDTAIVEVDAFLGNKFKGIVDEIAHSANVTGQIADQVTTFDVKILLIPETYNQLVTQLNPFPLRPGMSANVDIITQIKYLILAVPLESVTTRNIDKTDSLDSQQNKEVIFIVDKNMAVIQPVVTGIQDNNYIEIISGVKEGDKVITGPFSAVSKKLTNGTSITIVDKNKIFKN